ncbi:hypothetical protein CTI12_AA570850 [Artemisia annua]|uniref:Myb/SANT-like domain-containing protein n=1 Tax=Artemisia annua TaxID=35608 RepID=A0A2U1KS24_ARTAN|nr:hypothetical protein CTI12_AA570850 [Artemisia annua]
MELHVSGKYSGADNGFKPGYEKAVQALLDVSLPSSGLKADPHIKSSIVHDMLSGTGGTSGFGWDPEKCVLTAPDDVWDAYLKDKKQAAPFRNKALPYYEKLCTIFGKDRALIGRNASKALIFLKSSQQDIIIYIQMLGDGPLD